jgi:NitT/TauT family transport system substrate-binding protein
MTHPTRLRGVPLARAGLLASVLATILVLAGCGGGGAGEEIAKNDEGLTPLTVGVLPLADVAPLYLGIEKGFFEDEGLELKLQPAESGAALVASVQSGEVPIAYANPISVMQAREKGLPVTIVAQGELSMEPGKKPGDRTGQNLVVAPGSPITDVKGLSGKTVAVSSLGSNVELTARAAIDKRGGDSSKVKFIQIATPDQPAALESGQVDAAAINEPYASQILALGATAIAHPYTDLDDPASNMAVYFAQEEFIEANAEATEAFQRAIAKSFTYAQENLDEVRAIIPSYSKIPAETVAKVMLPYWTPDLNIDSLEELGRLAVKYDMLESEPDMDELTAYMNGGGA